MKFSLDRYLCWSREMGAKERDLDKMLKNSEWASYEGMGYEEVCKREPYVLKEWFNQEGK